MSKPNALNYWWQRAKAAEQELKTLEDVRKIAKKHNCKVYMFDDSIEYIGEKENVTKANEELIKLWGIE